MNNRAPGPVWGFSDTDRWLLMAFVFACLGLLAVHAWRLAARDAQTLRVERPAEYVLDYRIDVNAATWIEWMQLEGIGETLARRIVADRETNGPFLSVDDVDRVKGIGPVKLEKIRPHLTCRQADIPATQ